MSVTAYHFTTDTLRDGRPIPAIGETLRHEGKIELCKSGLHASMCPWDALSHAPGPLLHRVVVGGEILYGNDKLVASERTIRASIDATDLLRSFARQCALDVIHLWDAPDVVRKYLETGDESLRAAARAAARDAAKAAITAAKAATWAATAEAVTWAAAGVAVKATTTAALPAATTAAKAATWAVTWEAREAREAREAWETREAWEAARNAAEKAQHKRFKTMVDEALA